MMQLEFRKPFSAEVPASVNVFEFKKVTVRRSDFLDVLSNLDMMDEFYSIKWESKRDWQIAYHKRFRLAIHEKSGALRMWMKKQEEEDEDTPSKYTIPDMQSEFIARAFLRKANLIHESVGDLKLAIINHLYRQGSEITGKRTEPVMLDAGVILQRQIENIPVTGPGGFVSAFVKPDESVSAVTRIIRTIKGSKDKVKPISVDQAIEKFKRKLELQQRNGVVTVEKAEFAYFEMGKRTEQNFIEPVYCFVYSGLTKENNFGYKSAEVIPASNKPFNKY